MNPTWAETDYNKKREALRRLLENGVSDLDLNLEGEIHFSIAISLRRIADAMERSTQLPSATVDHPWWRR